MKKIVFFILTFVVVLSSCKSNDDNVTPTKTNKEYISAKTWILDELSSGGVITIYKKGATTNLYDFSKLELVLKADESVTGTDYLGQAIKGGTWAVNSDQTKVIFTNVNIQSLILSGEFTLNKINDTNFDVRGNVSYEGQNIDAIVKLIAK